MIAKSKKTSEIDVVFSFRNEEENINELVRRTSLALKSIKHRLIFVNDNSDDESLNILKKLQKKYPIIIINMSRRFGGAPCVIAGMRYSNSKFVAYMDSDLQDPPELLPKLLEHAKKNKIDVVHTRRVARKGENFFKMWLTKIAYKIINAFSEIELPNNVGDFKLISHTVVNEITKLNDFDPYMRGLSIWVGFKQDIINYSRDERFAGSTKYSMFQLGPYKEFIRGLISFSAAPLYISLFFGLLSFLISFGLIIWAILGKIFGFIVIGSSSVIIAISFFSGAILISLGLIGIYLSNIFYQVKNRPKYIIKNIIE